MKYYVFFTPTIHYVGGTQFYTKNKAQYLTQNGWNVKVLFDGNRNEIPKIQFFEQYLDGAFPFLSELPYQLPNGVADLAVKKICKYLEYDGNQSDEYLIESHNDILAVWGELIASRVKGKHICFICNESFHETGKHFDENLDFYYFKYLRKELRGIHQDSLQRLFEGYKTIIDSEQYRFVPCEGNPIQDIPFSKLDNLPKCDWTIIYFGRGAKITNVLLNEIAIFATKYQKKSISFIHVGGCFNGNEKMIFQTFSNCKNIIVTLIDALVPVPKCLLETANVILATSGCARYASVLNTKTVSIDVKTNMAIGVVGYSTQHTLFAEKDDTPVSISEAIEDVLVKKSFLQYAYQPLADLDSNRFFSEQLLLFDEIKTKDWFSFKTKKNEHIVRSIIKVVFSRNYYRVRKLLKY